MLNGDHIRFYDHMEFLGSSLASIAREESYNLKCRASSVRNRRKFYPLSKSGLKF